MYRIEVATGEETVFRTVEELATGIRNGLITPRSRIYHGASQKWLPIEFHPHYKKAIDLVTGGAPMIDTGLTRPPSSTRRPTPPASSAPRAAEPPPAPPAPAPAPVLPAPVFPAPRPAMIEPPRPAAPRSEHARFGPPRFGPPPFEAPRAEPPRAEPPAYSAPAVEEASEVAVAVALPPIQVPTVEIALPHISYPEVDPAGAEPPHPVARRRAKGSAPLALGGLVLAVLVGGYFATSSAARASETEPPPVAPSGNAMPAMDEEAEILGQDQEPEPETAAPAPAPTPTAAAAPAATPAVKPFGPAPKPTGPVSQAWSSSAGAIAPLAVPAPSSAPAPAAAIPEIAPAPGQLELALPRLPSADTIGAGARAAKDSAALTRILRAVGGRPPAKAAR